MAQTRRQAAKVLVAAITVVFGLAASLTSAQADTTTDNAKTQGQIGETAEGYLAARVSSISQTVQNAVNQVNLKRRAKYAELAQAGGVTVEVAATLTAEKLIARAKVGEYVRDAESKWHQVE